MIFAELRWHTSDRWDRRGDDKVDDRATVRSCRSSGSTSVENASSKIHDSRTEVAVQKSHVEVSAISSFIFGWISFFFPRRSWAASVKFQRFHRDRRGKPYFLFSIPKNLYSFIFYYYFFRVWRKYARDLCGSRQAHDPHRSSANCALQACGINLGIWFFFFIIFNYKRQDAEGHRNFADFILITSSPTEHSRILGILISNLFLWFFLLI